MQKEGKVENTLPSSITGAPDAHFGLFLLRMNHDLDGILIHLLMNGFFQSGQAIGMCNQLLDFQSSAIQEIYSTLMSIRIDHGSLDRPFLLIYLKQRQRNCPVYGRYTEKQDGGSASCGLEGLFGGKGFANALNDNIYAVSSCNFAESCRMVSGRASSSL